MRIELRDEDVVCVSMTVPMGSQVNDLDKRLAARLKELLGVDVTVLLFNAQNHNITVLSKPAPPENPDEFVYEMGEGPNGEPIIIAE